MKPTLTIWGVAAMAAVALGACSGGEKWAVNGKIDGAAGKTIVLESVDNGRWNLIDSASVGNDGSFAFKSERRDYPDIYRLTIDGRSLYFPIDSTETVTVAASIDGFDTDYKLSGSESAEMMQAINDRINRSLATGGEASIAGDSLLKRDIAQIITSNWTGIVSYYAINKTVGSTPLFDTSIAFDRKIINGVANQYDQQLPNDPRTKMLRNRSLENQRLYSTSTSGNKMYATEIPFIEIALKDRDGNVRSLTEEWEKGRVIVLNFTLLTAEAAPAYNVALSQVYDKYHDRGLEIYQVGCDDDEFAWSQAAKNLPWIAVFQTGGDATNLINYNVATIPTTYVIDRTGDRIERVEDVAKLDAIVGSMI